MSLPRYWRSPKIVAATLIAAFVAAIWYVKADHSPLAKSKDPAFASYITAYTSGMISRDGSIKIKLTNAFSDSSKMGSLRNLFEFSPEIEGQAHMTDAYTIEFKPKNLLPSGTVYEVAFNLGQLLEVPSKLEKFFFEFRTIEQAFELNDLILQASDNNDMRYQQLKGMLLTADISEDEKVEQILKATHAGVAMRIKWQHAADRVTHRFIIDSIERGKAATELLLSYNGASIDAGKKGEQKLQVPSLGDFKVMEVLAYDREEQYVSIRFSDPLKQNQELNGLITVNDLTDLRFTIERNEIKVYSNTNMIGTQVVKVATGIQNALGYKLKTGGTFNIEFEDKKPSVEILGKGVIMPDGEKLMLHFEATNLSAVDVQVDKIFENNITQFLQVNNLDGDYQLERVAPPILNKTLRLDVNKMLNLHGTNRFSIDLAQVMKAEPGAIYHVILGFTKEYSLYRCQVAEAGEIKDERVKSVYEGDEGEENMESTAEWQEEEEAEYNENGYYVEGYDWNQRDNPCHVSYYTWEHRRTRNVMASNLGIIAKRGTNNTLFACVTDIKTTKPLGGVSLELLDFQQQVITTTATDAQGWAHVKFEREPFLIVAKKGAERGYLRVDAGTALSLSHFDISGGVVQKGIKGFLYGERGVWRPGDSIYLSFILDDKGNTLPADYPVLFELYNPMGQLYYRTVNTKPLNGFYTFFTATGSEDPTGNWLARVKAGTATFEKNLKIETVVPNRLKINLSFPASAVNRGEEWKATLESKWLHGAVAANLRATVEVTYQRTATRFKKYEAYTFTDPSKNFKSETQEIFEGQLNDNGVATVEAKAESGESAPGMLTAFFTTKVFEEGGGFSTDRFSIPYHPYQNYIGVKMPQVDKRYSYYYETNKDHVLDVVCVDRNGNPLKGSKKVHAYFYKLEYRWWWDQSDENLSDYVNNEYKRPLKDEVITLNNGKGNWTVKVDYPDWGRYLVRIVDEESGHSTGTSFYVDWPYGYSRENRENSIQASMLTFSTNKETYKVGEDVVLKIPTGKDGRALISVESGTEVISTFWTDVKKGETQFSFKATKAMLPNVFVHVALLQPHAQVDNDLPIRLYGVMPVTVEDANTILKPQIKAPAVLRPEEPATIQVSEANGQAMTYTLAIVDEGLLDLTRFKTPDPHPEFYAREALGVRTWDIFDLVMGAQNGQLNTVLSIGGDEGINHKSKNNKANRFKPVVKFIGPVYLPAGKSKSHSITLPAYFGSVRIMVVAGQHHAYGKAEVAVPVRKPLMMLANLPRVLGIGEQVKLPVTVFAMENQVRDVRVEVSLNNLLKLRGASGKNIRFARPGEEVIDFDLTVPMQTGVAKVSITATSGKERVTTTLELDVRNPNPFSTRVKEVVVNSGQNWSGKVEPFGIAGTNKATIELSTIPPINLEKRLDYLVQYPHGCIEQTTSSVFPQLALNDLLELSKQRKSEIEYNIKAGINRLKMFQTGEGGFGYWPGDHTASEWGSNYAGHFIVEAQHFGYSIPGNMLADWKRYQKSRALNWLPSQESSRLEQAYRLYTLAMARAPELGAMNRLKEDKQLDVTSKWMLAAAYAINGQMDIAEQLIKGLPKTVPAYQDMGNTFGSDERDAAIILQTLTLLNLNNEASMVARQISINLSSDNWYSTQTTAWSLIAISKYCGRISNGKTFACTYVLNGKKTELVSKAFISQIPVSISGKNSVSFSVTNQNKQNLFVRIVTKGQNEVGDATDASSNLSMNVTYMDMKGNTINPESIEQGTDFVCKVALTNPGRMGWYYQMALSTVFPSGWQITNTRMMGENANFTSGPSDYQDFRDDRVYSYFSVGTGHTNVYYFLLNASYLGRFYLPPVVCEAMYHADIRARKGGIWVNVVPRSSKPVARTD